MLVVEAVDNTGDVESVDCTIPMTTKTKSKMCRSKYENENKKAIERVYEMVCKVDDSAV